MSFAKFYFAFLFFFLVYTPFSFASSVEWPEGSYKIDNLKVQFSKMSPFSSRDNKDKAKPSGLEYFGGVQSPVLDNVTLHAVDVIAPSSAGDIFSAYNFRGAIKQGAIQLIRIEDEDIYVNSELTFFDSDINAIYRHNEKLYFAGSDANGAFFSYAIIRNGQFINMASKIYIEGYVATDIIRARNSIYVTTADNGGLHSFFSEIENADWSYNIFDARSLYASPSDKKVYVLSGQPAKLYELNRNGQLLNTLEIGGALTPESKSFLVKSGSFLYATVGEAGIKVVCENVVVEQLDSIILPGFDPSATVTNALAVNKDFVFTANGEAGLYMYEKVSLAGSNLNSCCPLSLEELDHFNYWPEVSANHVALKGRFAFVASGAYGIQAFELE